ncbi:membrane protein [Gordoniibacillus kamchatkensis]|uniref:Membrane protein n=1 Tax=Gordoniibacillus kamchatkensis TaxID=1590651 RepID=A0ABR5A9W0_9BACL|nr:hypothetical protein [Paenibacillus sp. VKM B-2647]KIL37846.1 membrane protein [Paenibacillus sp. VKM B-2647]
MNQKSFFGVILIAIGIILFSVKGEALHAGSLFGYFWPSLFVLPLGVFFHWLYFSMTGRRGSGLLIPGGILLVSGIVCQLAMLFDLWGVLWPGFLLAVAAGLFEFYWFGGRNRWLLIPINILFVLSLLFFALFSLGALWNSLFGSRPILAIVLIAAGALLFLSSGRNKNTQL